MRCATPRAAGRAACVRPHARPPRPTAPSGPERTMTDPAPRTALYDELLRRFASGVRAAQLYAADHPLLARNLDGLLAALGALHQHTPSVPIGIVGNELVVSDTPMPKTSAGMS